MIGGKEDEGVFIKTLFLEGRDYPFHRVVHLHDKVAIHTQCAFSSPIDSGTDRRMRCGEPQEKEERFRLSLPGQIGIGLIEECFEHLVVFEMFFRVTDPVESAPTFLCGYLALPYIVFHKGVGIHVERTGQNEAVIKTKLRRTDLKRLCVIHIGLSLNLAVIKVPRCHLPMYSVL